MSSRFRPPWLPVAVSIYAALPGAALGATPPPGFQDSVVANASGPTAIAYEPGSHNLFVLEKGSNGSARVLRKDVAAGTTSTALTLSCVDGIGERGLLGIAFDPDYLLSPANRWVYLYYTRDVPASGACAIAGTSGSRNRVVRFLENGGALSGESLLLEGPVLQDQTYNHNGGTLRFAPDKTLFVSMGDNDSDALPNPFSRDFTDLRGKMLRIDRDGTIPASNPYVGQVGKRPEIWAWGLRNPFRFSIDPVTGIPWIADVGEDTWEEIDHGIKGADYGYPCYEANVPFRTCNPAPAPASVTFPVYAYGHGGQTSPVQGNSITGGPVYRNGNFPADYQGQLFFGDYGASWIRRATIGPGEQLSNIQLFIPDALQVVDIVQSPAGCLAWVSIDQGQIHETCYTAATNGAPIAIATADRTSGTAPLAVQFTGSASSDPDGDPLSFSWGFGDGEASSLIDPPHVFAADGVYQTTLTVDDGKGAPNSSTNSAPIRIVVGNRAPSATITAPMDGAHYDAGDTIAFSGGAADPEDGAIPSAGLTWSVVFHHDAHTHPFLPSIPGVSSGTFAIPASGEDSVHVWYRVHLTATDSGSPLGAAGVLQDSTYVDVLPNVSTITLDAAPAGQGLKVSFSGTSAVAPVANQAVAHFPRVIAAPTPQTAGGRTWTFEHWTDAMANNRTILTPESDTTFVAVFRCTSNCGALPDQDGDGFTVAQGDCNDLDPTVYPGAPDLCDGKNNDCSGTADDATCAAFSGTNDRVDGILLALLGRYFGSCSANPGAEPWGSVDYTRDGCLDGSDLAVMSVAWGCSGAAPLCPAK
jgi:glucose/arabinose dehydrogenase